MSRPSTVASHKLFNAGTCRGAAPGDPMAAAIRTPGMTAEQAEQFDAGISGRSRHANPHCIGITIHQNV